MARARAVIVITIGVLGGIVGGDLEAQERWRAGYGQAAIVRGAGHFSGIGANATMEMGVRRSLRAYIGVADWNAFGSCTVTDAVSACGEKAESLEIGLRGSLGASSRVAPFLGGGLGLYRLDGSLYERAHAFTVTMSAGIDIMVSAPLTVRVSLVHQEVPSQPVRDRLGTALRFTGFQVGIGFATWGTE
jgi:hypothetical protein